jgi:hypothetical protein
LIGARGSSIRQIRFIRLVPPFLMLVSGAPDSVASESRYRGNVFSSRSMRARASATFGCMSTSACAHRFTNAV